MAKSGPDCFKREPSAEIGFLPDTMHLHHQPPCTLCRDHIYKNLTHSVWMASIGLVSSTPDTQAAKLLRVLAAGVRLPSDERNMCWDSKGRTVDTRVGACSSTRSFIASIDEYFGTMRMTPDV